MSFANRYSRTNTRISAGYLDFSKLKSKMDFYQPPKNDYGAIDIVPYYIGTKNHPLVRTTPGEWKVGSMDYVLDVWVHKNIGAGSMSCVCPRLNYREPCPICEHIDELKKKKGRDDEEVKALLPKHRCIYNVWDAKNENSPYYLFDVSQYLFEKEVYDKAVLEGQRKGGATIDYADPAEGCTIEFRTSIEKLGKMDMVKFKDITFIKRDFKIEEKHIRAAVSLDSLLIVHSYEELQNFLYGAAEAEEEETTTEEEFAPPPRRGPQRNEEPIVEEPAEVSAPVRSRAERGHSPAPKTDCPYNHVFGTDNDKFKDCDNCDQWGACRAAHR